MRVLYLSHTSHMSGGERSLLDLLGGLPDRVSPVVACPSGELWDAVRAMGVQTVSVPGTDASLKLHPTRTALGVIDILRAARAVRRTSRRVKADLVHANSTRAGLVAVAAAKAGGSPAIVHLHDSLAQGTLASISRRVVIAGAAGLLPNSRHTAESFGIDDFDGTVRVVNNPVDLARFDPERLERDDCRSRLGLDPSSFVLLMVAQITPWKAQDDAIRALAQLSSDRAQLLLVGSTKFVSKATRFDNRAYLNDLRALVDRLGVGEQVTFLGEREDVPEILRASDVLLAPSWQEPFGRAVTEAMAMGMPVVATSAGGPAEIVRDGVEGFLRPPRDPEAWAQAVRDLLADPSLRRSMGSAGRRRVAQSFSQDAHVRAVLSAYDEVLGVRGRGGASG